MSAPDRPDLTLRRPSYRKHAASGQALMTLRGAGVYLGKYGTKESWGKYWRLLAELYVSRGLPVPPDVALGVAGAGVTERSITVVEAASRYLNHLATREDLRGDSERNRAHAMLKVLVDMFQLERAGKLTPPDLRRVRAAMVARGWSRSYVNQLMEVLKRMLRWLAEESLVPMAVYQRLALVRGLKKGEGGVRESEPVLPVSDSVIDKTLPHLPETVADLVRLERLTGMRHGEVCALRPCDVDREHAGGVWVYRPAEHKTERYDKDRVVALGPRAQEVLAPYLEGRAPDAHCFQPRESEARRRTVRGCGRRRPIADLADRYDVCTYRRAIHRACDRAFPHPDATVDADGEEGVRTMPSSDELRAWRSEHRWSPNQLRHTFATEARAKLGLEAAQIALGHSRADVTQIYAERDLNKAVDVAMRIG